MCSHTGCAWPSTPTAAPCHVLFFPVCSVLAGRLASGLSTFTEGFQLPQVTHATGLNSAHPPAPPPCYERSWAHRSTHCSWSRVTSPPASCSHSSSWLQPGRCCTRLLRVAQRPPPSNTACNRYMEPVWWCTEDGCDVCIVMCDVCIVHCALCILRASRHLSDRPVFRDSGRSSCLGRVAQHRFWRTHAPKAIQNGPNGRETVVHV